MLLAPITLAPALLYCSMIAFAPVQESQPDLEKVYDIATKLSEQIHELQGRAEESASQFKVIQVHIAELNAEHEKLQMEQAESAVRLKNLQAQVQSLKSHLQNGTPWTYKGRTYTVEEIKENIERRIEMSVQYKERVESTSKISSETKQRIEQMRIQLAKIDEKRSQFKQKLSSLQTMLEKVRTLEMDESTKKILKTTTEKIKELEAELETVMTAAESIGDGNTDEWVQLFNGVDLEGWTPKIRGYELGENFGNTFRVEDKLLKVNYDSYEDGYNRRFGHLFYKDSFSHYILRVEYRFVGEQVAGGPGWALRNSGVMLHCQDPATMSKDQDFPVSIEMQMLGGDGTNPRTNANVCTPGTHLEMDGKLVKRHCISSNSETYHGDQWVTVEVEVRGDEVIRHKIDGKVVLEYQKPQLDPNDGNAAKLVKDGVVELKEGFISLQSESHPIEFRKVEIKVLDDD